MCQKRKKNIGKITPPYEFCLLLTTLQNQFSPHIQYIPLPLSLPVQSQSRYSFLCAKLLDGFTSNFQELLLRIPIFAWYSVVRLSVCLSVKKLDRTSPPKLLDGFTSNFQELLLRIPIFACSSVVRLSVCQNTWVRRLTPALALKYFVLVFNRWRNVVDVISKTDNCHHMSVHVSLEFLTQKTQMLKSARKIGTRVF